MEKQKELTINLPKGFPNNFIQVATKGRSIVIIGANGSGKSRLGAWIESYSSFKKVTHRISAQKSLAMPDTTTISSLKNAEMYLRYGHNTLHKIDTDPAIYRINNRWRHKPNTNELSDFNYLMEYLHTEHAEVTNQYYQQSFEPDHKKIRPESKIMAVKRIWEKILPHRELKINTGRIEVKVNIEEEKNNTKDPYDASEMSDGERVVFYLIGQCLGAPANGLIIIDEPEIHLHKSIQTKLWREIEEERKDCLFVYLTHDVDFAASQKNALKIWLKKFDGENWDWEVLEDIEGFPENLLVKVLGSRQPILFVEGEKESYDTALYIEIYPDHLVIPRGGCSQVISSTKILRNHHYLHHLEISGIIDRDRRGDTEIPSLKKDCIYVIDVAEVENLFCLPEVLKIVSDHLKRDANNDFKKVKKYVIDSLKKEFETQISIFVANEIKYKLNVFNDKAKGETKLKSELNTLINSIDINALYSQKEKEFNQAIQNEDYLGVLGLYNRKTLPSRISQYFGLDNGELPNLVIRLLKSEKREDLMKAFKKYLPVLPSVK